MEKLLLGCFLSSFQKMHIVDEQQIGFPVSTSKFGTGSIEHGADQLVHKLLGTYVCDASVGTPQQRLMRYGLHEVRLAQTGISVDEKGVVNLSRSLAYCMSCCRCQLI